MMITQHRIWVLSTALVLVACSDDDPVMSNCRDEWVQNAGNPVISYGQVIPMSIWNDPSVIKEGTVFTMWLSSGTGSGRVDVYKATSMDGIDWTIDPAPQVSPGPGGTWDDLAIETPSVIEVGGTYHLYYTGCDTLDCPTAKFDIGHATSTDGETWTKDPNNPVIARPNNGKGPPDGQPNVWGWFNVAEPGIVFNDTDGMFYLYYVATRCRENDCSGAQPVSEIGIMLATSPDGSNFTVHPNSPILTQSSTYPFSQQYSGYSTPMAYRSDDGMFHLYHDVAKYLDPSNVFRQVAIAHAVSSNGVDFTEVETDIFVFGQGDWIDYEVRSPTVLDDNGSLLMWFAGNNGNNLQDPGFEIGIGFATFETICE